MVVVSETCKSVPPTGHTTHVPRYLGRYRQHLGMYICADAPLLQVPRSHICILAVLQSTCGQPRLVGRCLAPLVHYWFGVTSRPQHPLTLCDNHRSLRRRLVLILLSTSSSNNIRNNITLALAAAQSLCLEIANYGHLLRLACCI